MQNTNISRLNAIMYTKKLTDCSPRGECSVYVNVFPIVNNRVPSTFMCFLNACEFNSVQPSPFLSLSSSSSESNNSELIEGTANYDRWTKSNSLTHFCKVLLDNSNTHSLHIFCGCFHVMYWHFMHCSSRVGYL